MGAYPPKGVPILIGIVVVETLEVQLIAMGRGLEGYRILFCILGIDLDAEHIVLAIVKITPQILHPHPFLPQGIGREHPKIDVLVVI